MESLPESYLLNMENKTQYKNGTMAFISRIDSNRFVNRLNRSIDTLCFSGYVQPGIYRFYTYNEATDYEVNSTTLSVKADGESVVRNPKPLFLGVWQQDIAKKDSVSAEVSVRQRTRRITFCLLLDMSDSISYVSSEVSLSNIYSQIDLSTGSLDSNHLVTLPLQMTEGSLNISGVKPPRSIKGTVR